MNLAIQPLQPLDKAASSLLHPVAIQCPRTNRLHQVRLPLSLSYDEGVGQRISTWKHEYSQHLAIWPQPGLSSSETFGNEIKTLLQGKSQTESAKNTPVSFLPALTGLNPHSITSVEGWPSEEEANELLELFILNLGISQQLFDIRSFSDNLSHLYNNTSTGALLPDLWLVQVLLVFAIGRLLRAGTHESDVPGTVFFDQAMVHIPNMSNIRAYGTLGMEVLSLAALFLQIADRKDEAYLHVRISAQVRNLL